jgi:hypothetical protein
MVAHGRLPRGTTADSPRGDPSAVTLVAGMGGFKAMYYADLLRTIRRFWYFAVAGLVATAMLCLLAARVVPPDYEAQAKVLMVPALAPATPGGADNPLLGIGGLQPTADTLALAFGDSTVQDALVKEGTTGTYEVVLDPVSKSPVLSVTATDSSPAAAMTTLKLVVAEVPRVLADLEGRIAVPKRARLSTLVISQDQQAELVLKSRVRLLGAVGGLGLALSFGLMVFLSSRERQRQFAAPRRSASGSAGSEPVRSWAESDDALPVVRGRIMTGRLERQFARGSRSAEADNEDTMRLSR